MKYVYHCPKVAFLQRACLSSGQLTLTLKLIVFALVFSLVQVSAKEHHGKIIITLSDVHIKGTVIDSATGEPLTGVTIQIKGTTNGTTTDANGKFDIEVSDNAVLIVSSLGYNTQEIKVDGATTLNIHLSASKSALNEVVVTALGIKQEKKALAYATQVVNGTSLEKVREPTALGSLTGRVAGLDIQNTTNLFENPGISLRGETPLIVIDGIPEPNADPWKINADDIESVTVLKGTSAAALYGAQGINGAILFTTKKGTIGKLTVDINSSTQFQTGYLVIPKVQTQYGDGDNGVYSYVDGSGGGTEGGGWVWGPELNQKDPSTASGYWETPQYNSPIDPATGQLVPLPWISRGANNIKNFFRMGMLSTNAISASEGSEKGSFRISATNEYQQGIMPNTSLNIISFSAGGEYAITPKLHMNTKLTFNKEFSPNYPTIGYGPVNVLYNLILWMGADVDIRDLRNYWVKGEQGIQQLNYNNSWYNNPYFVANQLLNGYTNDNTFGEATFTYTFNKDLSLEFRNGFNESDVNETYEEPYSYISYDYISEGNYSITKNNNFDITSDLILTYKHTFSKNFNINITAGGSNFFANYQSDYISTNGLSIPGLYNLGNSINPLAGSNSILQNRISSLYGMLNMEALHFLYFSFTGRRDQVSTLPVNHDAYFYPSAGISAVISDIVKLPKVISFLKARSSWALVNSGVISSSNPYAQLLTYSIGTKWNNVPSLSWPNTAIAPTLLPESTLSGEYGLVLGLFNDRINIDATFFRNKDYNNLTTVPQSQASGYSSVLTNAISFIRKGWEYMFSATPVEGENFKWNTSINFSNVHTWLQKAAPGQHGYYETYIKQGQRIDGAYITQARTPKGVPIDYSNGYEATAPYASLLGYTDPVGIYGWQNSLTYKKFTLSFSFDGRLGGLIYSTTNQKMWWGGTSPGTVNKYRVAANQGISNYVAPGVVVTGGNVTYDANGNIVTDTRTYAPNTTPVNYISFMQTTSGDMLNHYFYYSGTYITLRALSLTYTLPSELLKGIFNTASVSLIGNNLFILDKIPNIDPDALGDGNMQSPAIRSVGVNLNLRF
jgi:TonB-linked SusC/RagA family outer membrane protein